MLLFLLLELEEIGHVECEARTYENLPLCFDIELFLPDCTLKLLLGLPLILLLRVALLDFVTKLCHFYKLVRLER